MKAQAKTWTLPTQDDWSTPFAEVLLEQLDLRPGLTILDIASGHGIPAFYLAEQVGETGTVIGIDASRSQVASARAIQRGELPWLRFDCQDMRAIPASFPTFQRITGNLSVMFLRPNRFEAMRGLIDHLAPGGQAVLTFPSSARSTPSGDGSIRKWADTDLSSSGNDWQPMWRSGHRRQKRVDGWSGLNWSGSPSSSSRWRLSAGPANGSSSIRFSEAGSSTMPMNVSTISGWRRR